MRAVQVHTLRFVVVGLLIFGVLGLGTSIGRAQDAATDVGTPETVDLDSSTSTDVTDSETDTPVDDTTDAGDDALPAEDVSDSVDETPPEDEGNATATDSADDTGDDATEETESPATPTDASGAPDDAAPSDEPDGTDGPADPVGTPDLAEPDDAATPEDAATPDDVSVAADDDTGTVVITITDEQGNPRGGSCANLQNANDLRGACDATDGLDGIITITDLPAGTWEITGSLDEECLGLVSGSSSVIVTADETVSVSLQLTYVGCGTVVVHPVDADDISYLESACFELDGGVYEERVCADGGSAIFTSVPAGAYSISVSSLATGYVGVIDVVDVTVVADETVEINFELKQVGTGTVAIRTVSQDDPETLLPDACYQIDFYQAQGCDFDDGANDGVTHFVATTAGEHTLSQDKGPLGYTASESIIAVTIIADQETAVTFTQDSPQTGSLVIHFVDQNGNPAPGVCFQLYTEANGPSRPACDGPPPGELFGDGIADGTYRDSSVGPGQWLIQSYGTGQGGSVLFDTTSVLVESGQTTDVTITLTQATALIQAVVCTFETTGDPYLEVDVLAQVPDSLVASDADVMSNCTLSTRYPFISLTYERVDDAHSGRINIPRESGRGDAVIEPGSYTFAATVAATDSYSVTGIEQEIVAGGTYVFFLQFYDTVAPSPRPTVAAPATGGTGDLELFAFDCAGSDTSFLVAPPPGEANPTPQPGSEPGGEIGAGFDNETTTPDGCQATRSVVQLDDGEPFAIENGVTVSNLSSGIHTLTDACFDASTEVPILNGRTTKVFILNPEACELSTPTPIPTTPHPSPTATTDGVTHLPVTGSGQPRQRDALPFALLISLFLSTAAILSRLRRPSLNG